jgi:hypothetical protein
MHEMNKVHSVAVSKILLIAAPHCNTSRDCPLLRAAEHPDYTLRTFFTLCRLEIDPQRASAEGNFICVRRQFLGQNSICHCSAGSNTSDMLSQLGDSIEVVRNKYISEDGSTAIIKI